MFLTLSLCIFFFFWYLTLSLFRSKFFGEGALVFIEVMYVGVLIIRFFVDENKVAFVHVDECGNFWKPTEILKYPEGFHSPSLCSCNGWAFH